MIQYIKFGQNLSFGSTDRVETRFFRSKFDIQSACVTLKMSSRSKSKNLNISSHVSMVFLCKFGKNPLTGSGDNCRQDKSLLCGDLEN